MNDEQRAQAVITGMTDDTRQMFCRCKKERVEGRVLLQATTHVFVWMDRGHRVWQCTECKNLQRGVRLHD